MSKIFDCFMFFNEFDILELRLKETFDVVDYFVVVEATTSYVGAAKPLYFMENKARFRPYLDKIIHVVVDDMPNNGDTTVNEFFQRNCIIRGLGQARPDDIIIVSDCDEIIRSGVLRDVRLRPEELFCFYMPIFYFRLNYMCVSGEVHSIWPMAIRGRHISRVTPNGLRNARFRYQAGLKAQLAAHELVRSYDHSGWHFSYMGNEAHVRHKIENCFNTPEYNRPDQLNALNLDALMDAGRDLYGRAGYAWAKVELTDYFPMEVIKNRDRYDNLIAKDPRINVATYGWKSLY